MSRLPANESSPGPGSGAAEARAAVPLDDLKGLAPLDTIAQLSERITRLIEENQGLADEVLRCYEQLNVIFDIAQQVAHLVNVSDIEQVLAERIATLLGAEAAVVIDSEGAPRSRPAPALLPGVLLEAAAHLDKARQTRRVVVTCLGPHQLILGPLVRLDGRVDVILALRRGEIQDFRSGDVLMLDSVLSFGGQIISNTELHEKLGRTLFEVTRALVAAIDKKDHYTSGHSERVGFFARLTGQQMGLTAEQLQILEWSGLLHDVGKIGIPEEILNKPDRLTEEEFGIIKRHPVMGYEILKPIRSFEGVLEGVLHHHEAPDGTGYPDGLKGDETPLAARIIHVVDIFDALTSTRAYRAPFSVEKAIEILRAESGTKVDPQVTAAFLAALERWRCENPARFTETFRSKGSLEIRPDPPAEERREEPPAGTGA
jgi:HD-GYP domain-containing protein (c-di-GMP phosphodiesterase class II)